ncbi:unnamed protein product [Gordionus sp. m RMFG-2023]
MPPPLLGYVNENKNPSHSIHKRKNFIKNIFIANTKKKNKTVDHYMQDEQEVSWYVYDFLINWDTHDIEIERNLSTNLVKKSKTNISSEPFNDVSNHESFGFVGSDMENSEVDELALYPSSNYNISLKSVQEVCQDTQNVTKDSDWMSAFVFKTSRTCYCRKVHSIQGISGNISLYGLMPEIICHGFHLTDILSSFNLLYFAFNYVNKITRSKYSEDILSAPEIAALIELVIIDFLISDFMLIPCLVSQKTSIIRDNNHYLISTGWKMDHLRLALLCLNNGLPPTYLYVDDYTTDKTKIKYTGNPYSLLKIQKLILDTCTFYRTNFKYISLKKLGGSVCTCIEFNWPNLFVSCDGAKTAPNLVKSFNKLYQNFLKHHIDTRKTENMNNGIKSIILIIKNKPRDFPRLYLCNAIYNNIKSISNSKTDSQIPLKPYINISNDGTLYEIPMDTISPLDILYADKRTGEKKINFNTCLENKLCMISWDSQKRVKEISSRSSHNYETNFSQANQNMTETINLPASNTENTQLYGTQVKIPETTNLYSQYHFQNIPKNLGPQSKTIPAKF